MSLFPFDLCVDLCSGTRRIYPDHRSVSSGDIVGMYFIIESGQLGQGPQADYHYRRT